MGFIKWLDKNVIESKQLNSTSTTIKYYTKHKVDIMLVECGVELYYSAFESMITSKWHNLVKLVHNIP